jgi:uncharacterized protein (DUF983 family)
MSDIPEGQRYQRDWRDERPPGASRMLLRAIFLHCPRCGQPKILQGWFKLPAPCPRCGMNFNPDGDAAVGWMIVNLGVTMAVFFCTAFGGMVLTWPKVPWTGLTIFTICLNVVVPPLPGAVLPHGVVGDLPAAAPDGRVDGRPGLLRRRTVPCQWPTGAAPTPDQRGAA